MADGSAMRATMKSDGDGDGGDMRPVSLDKAITLLEADQGAGLLVDLGNGRTATAAGHRGDEGLLQRLRGHRMMIAMASGAADLSRFGPNTGKVYVAPLVQEILDATKQKD